MSGGDVAAPLGRRGRLRGLDVFVVLVGLHVVVKLLLFPRVADAPLSGDEVAYVDGAKALSNLVRDLVGLGPVDTAEVRRNVVGNGWFMPGMSAVLTPLFLVVPDAGPTLVRGFLGVVHVLLLVWAAASVRRTLGEVHAWALLAFACLVPVWVLFSYAGWGDLAAGLLIAVVVGRLVALFRGLPHGEVPSARQGAGLGLLLVVTLYLRSSALPLVVGLVVVVVIGLVVLLRRGLLVRSVPFVLTTVAVFVAVLLPWSVAASKALDGRVVTTSTLPLSIGVAFGDERRICYGQCPPGSVFLNGVRYSREVAQVTGRSELEVQAEMSEYARQGVTSREYAAAVLDNADRYLMNPTAFEARLRPGTDEGGPVSDVLRGVTDLGYFALLAAGAVVMLLVTRQTLSAQLTSVLVKLVAFALLLQPLVHIGSGRYWPTFGPLLVLGAVLLGQVVGGLVRGRTGGVGGPPAGGALPVTAPPMVFLTVVQALLAALFVAAVAVLLVLGR